MIDALVKTVVVPISLISTVITAVKVPRADVFFVQVGFAAQLINDPVVPEDRVPDVTVAIASYFDAEVVGTTQFPKDVVPPGDIIESIEPVLDNLYADEGTAGVASVDVIVTLEILTKSPPPANSIMPIPLIRRSQRR